MNYVDQLLGQNEALVLITRQSWVVLVREAIVDFVVALIFIIITVFAQTLTFVQPFGWLLGLLILFPAGRFVYRFLQWANEEYIVTNRRVIQINGLVNKNVIDSSLEKVNDVRMTQSVLGRLFNYGDVEILTASELGSNLFQRIGDPIGFKTAMLNEKEKLGFAENAAIPPPAAPKPLDIPSLIASLSAMRKEGMITEEEYEKKKAELLARM